MTDWPKPLLSYYSVKADEVEVGDCLLHGRDDRGYSVVVRIDREKEWVNFWHDGPNGDKPASFKVNTEATTYGALLDLIFMRP